MKQSSLGLRRRAWRRGVAATAVAALGVTGAWMAVPAAGAPSAGAGTVCEPTEGFAGCRLFTATGAAEKFRVPAGVKELDVRAWGQGGRGNSMSSGGAGAYAAGKLSVDEGEVLSVAVASRDFGDALGGKAGAPGVGEGGASSGIRASDGKPLLIAAGGGGSTDVVIPNAGDAGAGGAERGQDATEATGGKGAEGAKGGAGGGNGAAGADASAGGKGGDGGTGRYGGGGGGGGYAGGGGGAGSDVDETAGSGGGGTSYADPKRMTDVRMVVSDGAKAPAKDDPFWESSDNPIDSGIAEGGVNAPGGVGRVVLQWATPAVAELAKASGDDQTRDPDELFDPVAVVARDKDGTPVEDATVTFTIEDPNGTGVSFDAYDPVRKVVVATDEYGRAQAPAVAADKTEGAFTVRAVAQGRAAVFTGQVKKLAYSVTAVQGDGQRTGPEEAFGDKLQALVEVDGAPKAGVTVRFDVEYTSSRSGPRFSPDFYVVGVQAKTDAEGIATTPVLYAGTDPGTYTVVATRGEASATFTVEVGEDNSSGEPTPSPSASAEPSGSASPAPSASSSGGTDTSGAGGAQGDGSGGTGGGLAVTGAGGIGLLLGTAAVLAGLGVLALRLRTRLQNRG
ncbi:hypothetical protein ACIHJG_16680 [Streptomyces sp. NPDC052415]|uniref:hypothetical protein n=1 Tax=Streptomyces sp. NPDC052415 TaxID=3365690 RepID=UPI0037D81C1A